MTEAQFQQQVIALAKLFGWHVAHFRPARQGKGWVTPVSADGAGFPDLFMARDDRTVVAELKMPKGQLTLEQYEWLELLRRNPGNEVYLWEPDDLEAIAEILRR